MAIRAFAALELPVPVKEALSREIARLAREFPRDVKWPAPDTLHLTLKFFASLPEERIEVVTRAIGDVRSQFGPIGLALGRRGAFPSPSRPRVLWVGLDGDVERLRDLQADFDRRLSEAGFPPEERPFAAHITLGRIRPEASAETTRRLAALVQGALATGGPGQGQRFRVEELTLFRSVLGSGGPIYTRLHTARLASGEASGD